MFENRVIFHVDVNAAYLSWEAVYRLRHLGAKEDLRKQAAGVGAIRLSVMGSFWQSPFLPRDTGSAQVKVF